MAATLQELLDKRALDDLVHITVTALDAGEWGVYRAGFAEDATFLLPDHTGSGEKSVVTGADNFIPIVSAVLGGFDAVQHHITNMIHRLSGDEAATFCYVIAEHFFGRGPGENSLSVGGHYDIAARREHGEWKLTAWNFTPAWTRGNAALFDQAAGRQAP